MESRLQQYLQTHHALSAQEAAFIQGLSRKLSPDAAEILLRPGQVATSFLFVEEGVLRTFEYDDEGNDLTKFFFSEGQFVTNLHSYTSGQPSDFSIETLTPCTIRSFDKAATGEIPNWANLFSALLQKELGKKVRDQYYLRNHDARETYARFLHRHGDLVNRVPLKHIASYLGIAPPTLRRVRRAG